MQALELVPYVTHLAALGAGLGTVPAYGKLRAAFISLCRAVVAHEDGDDGKALADLKDVVEDVEQAVSPIYVRAIAVGNIKAGSLVEYISPPAIPTTPSPIVTLEPVAIPKSPLEGTGVVIPTAPVAAWPTK